MNIIIKRNDPWSKVATVTAVTLLGVGAIVASENTHDGWKDLFNGKDFTGWTQKGGKAIYTVEDGAIVGHSVVNTPNSFMCTTREYGDFILEYDYKVDPSLNSGVQIRSKYFEKPFVYEWKGEKIKAPLRRVHGYQIEIDPNPKRKRFWSGGIYDEARRGWLCPGKLGGDKEAFTKQGEKCYKPREWNHVRVEAVGTSIRTWLNGTPRASIVDGLTRRGLIGLQVHNIGKNKQHAGLKVAWKNIRIKEVKPGTGVNSLTSDEISHGWCMLWDGKTTNGWRGAKLKDFPQHGWSIKDGILSVQGTDGQESTHGGDIITRQRYARFDLQLEFKITPGANSGVKYFCQPNLDPITGEGAKSKKGSAIGLEYQILDDVRHPDAKKGKNGNRTLASLYDLLTADTGKKPNPVGEWNKARIVTDGVHVEHWLNGKKVLSYERGTPEFRKLVKESKYHNIPGFGEWPDGHILLQDHGNAVSFRNIKIFVPPAPKK